MYLYIWVFAHGGFFPLYMTLFFLLYIKQNKEISNDERELSIHSG